MAGLGGLHARRRRRSQFPEKEDTGKSTTSVTREVKSLPDDERAKLTELLVGPNFLDPLDHQDLKDLAVWYGFHYYPGIQK